MKSKYRNFVVVAAFVLLAGSLVVIAQDGNTPDKNQKIGDLEQEVTNLQNQIQFLRAGATEQLANEEIETPRPAYDLRSGAGFDAPTPNSVYSVNPAMQPTFPSTGDTPPEYGYSPQTPSSPWAVVPPTHFVPTPVAQYVPVQVPVYVETAPCWVDYGPVFDPYFPSPAGFNFWFSGNGNHKHHKHKH